MNIIVMVQLKVKGAAVLCFFCGFALALAKDHWREDLHPGSYFVGVRRYLATISTVYVCKAH